MRCWCSSICIGQPQTGNFTSPSWGELLPPLEAQPWLMTWPVRLAVVQPISAQASAISIVPWLGGVKVPTLDCSFHAG